MSGARALRRDLGRGVELGYAARESNPAAFVGVGAVNTVDIPDLAPTPFVMPKLPAMAHIHIPVLSLNAANAAYVVQIRRIINGVTSVVTSAARSAPSQSGRAHAVDVFKRLSLAEFVPGDLIVLKASLYLGAAGATSASLTASVAAPAFFHIVTC